MNYKYIYSHAHPLHAHTHTHTKNRTNGKQQFPLVCCKQEKETANFRLFAANGNGKLVFLGRQTINGNRRLLFRQMCPSTSMYEYILYIYCSAVNLSNVLIFLFSSVGAMKF